MRFDSKAATATKLAILAAIVAVTLLAHGGSLTLPWLTFDDQIYVAMNPFLHPPSLGMLRAAWTTPYYHDYIPVTHSTYWLDARFGGDHVLGYHLQSLLWHLIAAMLVVSVLSRWCGDPGIGAAAGILFAAHPLVVESVAWVSSRKNVVSFALMLGALDLFQRSVTERDDHGGETAEKRSVRIGVWSVRWPGYAVSFVLFLLAVLAKTTSLVLPGLILIDLWVRKRRGVLSALPLAAPFAVVAMVMLPLLASLRLDQPEVRLGGSILGTLAADVPILARYVVNTLWPGHLAIIYAVKAGPHLTSSLLLGATGLLLAALAVPFAWLRRRREGAALIGWTLVCLVPSLNLSLQANPLADRFFYWSLPALIGFFVLAAVDGATRLAALWGLRPIWMKSALGAALLFVVAGLCFGSRQRVPLFGSTIDLMEDAQRKNPDSSMANMHLALALMDRFDTRQNEPMRDRVAGLFQAMAGAADADYLLKPPAIDRGAIFVAVWHAKRGRAAEGDRIMLARFGSRADSLDTTLAWAKYFVETGKYRQAMSRLEQKLLEGGPDGAPRTPGVRELRDRLRTLQGLPFDQPVSIVTPPGDPYRGALERRELFTAAQLLGRAYRGLGLYLAALSMSSVAVALSPDDATALGELEMDYRAVGDERRARAVEARLATLARSKGGAT